VTRVFYSKYMELMVVVQIGSIKNLTLILSSEFFHTDKLLSSDMAMELYHQVKAIFFLILLAFLVLLKIPTMDLLTSH